MFFCLQLCFLRDWCIPSCSFCSLWGNSVVYDVVDAISVESGNRTLLQHLVTLITDKLLPNYGLLMLWALLANAIPITFWAVAFILSNPTVYQTAMEQINAAL